MIISIIGESCVGKSTLANQLKEKMNLKIFTGKDYLRLNKNEVEAKKEFKNLLENTNDNIIYIISEIEHLSLLPENAFKILMVADLEVIKERFKKRLNGNLPLPVEKMIEKKHGIFNHIDYNYMIENSSYSIEELLDKLNID